MTDQEAEGELESLRRDFGYRVRAAIAYGIGPAEDGVLRLPEVTASRGGLEWGKVITTPPKPPEPVDPPPPGAPAGHWQYAIRGEEDEIYATASTYDWVPFRTKGDAIEAWGDEGALVRRWVPNPWDWEDA